MEKGKQICKRRQGPLIGRRRWHKKGNFHKRKERSYKSGDVAQKKKRSHARRYQCGNAPEPRVTVMGVRPTSMHAQDSLLDGGSQGEPVEEAVEALPSPDALLLSQPLCALQPEPKQRIDVRCLHSTASAPQHWKQTLQCMAVRDKKPNCTSSFRPEVNKFACLFLSFLSGVCTGPSMCCLVLLGTKYT